MVHESSSSGETLSRELLNSAGLDPNNDPYKPLRPTEIASSEQHVRNVISVLEALRIYLIFGIMGKFRQMNFERSESFVKIRHFISELKEINYLHLNLPKIKLL